MPTYFEFSNEFGNYLELFGMSSIDGEFRTVLSMLGEADRTGTNAYLVEDDDIGDYVGVQDQVLLGKISFQVLGEEEITDKAFQLKEGNSPKTGIKVNINGVDSYEAPSLFQFVLDLASDNAYLTNIEMDKATIENYDKTIFNYIVTLEEDTDILEVTPTKEDEKAVITIEGNEVESGNPYPIKLNPIGEETEIEILVTAEDGVTQNTYKILVQGHGGIIKGSIVTNSLKEGENGIIHTADIKIYRQGEVDWENLFGRDELDLIETVKIVKTNEDGTYSVPLSPGEYDLLIDKPGYLDVIVIQITIENKTEIDLGETIMVAGDITKMVDNTKDGYYVLIMAKDVNATVRLGEEEATGSLRTFIPVADMAKEVKFTIIAENGEQQEYSLTMVKASNNINVQLVELNDYPASMTNPDKLIYEKMIPKLADTIKVKVVTENPYATVKIGDTSTKEGQSVEDIPLDLKEDVITIPVVVKAPDGYTVKTYNIILIRGRNNTDITKVTVEGKEIPYVNSKYVAKVTGNIDTAEVKIKVSDEEATIEFNGDKSLGNITSQVTLTGIITTKEIKVIAQDGTVKYYTLEIHRQMSIAGTISTPENVNNEHIAKITGILLDVNK